MLVVNSGTICVEFYVRLKVCNISTIVEKLRCAIKTFSGIDTQQSSFYHHSVAFIFAAFTREFSHADKSRGFPRFTSSTNRFAVLRNHVLLPAADTNEAVLLHNFVRMPRFINNR